MPSSVENCDSVDGPEEYTFYEDQEDLREARPEHWSRESLALVALSFLTACEGIGPFGTAWLASNPFHRYGPEQLGILLAIEEGGRTLFFPYMGKLVDISLCKRALLAVGSLLVGFSVVVTVFLPQWYWAQVLVKIPLALGTCLVPLSLNALTLGTTPLSRFTKQTAVNRAGISMGTVTSSFAMALLSRTYTGSQFWSVLPITFSGLAVLAVPLIRNSRIDHAKAACKASPHQERAEELEEPTSPIQMVRLMSRNSSKDLEVAATNTGSGILSLLRLKGFAHLLAIAFFFNMCNMPILQMVVQEAASSDPDNGLVFASAAQIIGNSVMILSSGIVFHLADSVGHHLLLLACAMVLPTRAMLGAFMGAASPWPGLTVVQILDGVGAGLWEPISVLIIREITDSTGCYNLATACLKVVFSLGALVGSITSGAIAERLNFGAALASCTVVGIIFLLLVARFPETHKRSESSVEDAAQSKDGNHTKKTRLTSLVVVLVCVITGVGFFAMPGRSHMNGITHGSLLTQGGEHCNRASNHTCSRSKSPKHANGLIFIGLSLSRRAPQAHNRSVSRQTQFDFDRLQDRDYRYVCETNDDGWLVGGGEGEASSGLSSAWKLPNPDSAHIEIAHIGNGDLEHGGLTRDMVAEKMRGIGFPPIRIKPSRLALNGDDPPEVELQFTPVDNHELVELQDQLRKVFVNPSTSWPDHFHMSISRKLRFYSREDRDAFLRRGQAAIEEWRNRYPDGVVLQPDPEEVRRGVVSHEEIDKPGGVYLFWGRNTIYEYFPPTLPPAPSLHHDLRNNAEDKNETTALELGDHCRSKHKCERSKSARHANGLIFIGLSLSRRTPLGNNVSITRQTQFDFNLLQDREHRYTCETNDDGWLVGGGEGGDSSDLSNAWKLPNPDSAHVEIAHIGNGDLEHGGLTRDMISEKMRSIQFPPIRIKPSVLVLNGDDPPEVELQFAPVDNRELAELQDTLRKVFVNPSTSWPDHFHMSISRKLRFYSREDRDAFLRRGQAAIEEWRNRYPDGVVLQPDPEEVRRGVVSQEEIDKPGGVYLFWGRNTIYEYFPPSTVGGNGTLVIAGSDSTSDDLELESYVVYFTLIVYGLAWVLLMWPEQMPLGRPGIAFSFAVLVCGARWLNGTPIDVFSKIDPDPIVLLFGLMLVNAYLQDTGIWQHLERFLDDESPRRMMIKICLAAAVISALFLNDTTCIIMTPCVLKLCTQRKASKALPFLLAVSTSSNIGSSLTITGNPQNALIASLCPSINFIGFMLTMVIPVIIGVSLNIVILLSKFGDDLQFDCDSSDCHEWSPSSDCIRRHSSRELELVLLDEDVPIRRKSRRRNSNGALVKIDLAELDASITRQKFAKAFYVTIVGLIVFTMLCGWFAGLETHVTAVGAGAALMFARAFLRRCSSGNKTDEEHETDFVTRQIDFSLLILFAGQFVLVGAVVDTGVPQQVFRMALGSYTENLDGSFVGIFLFSAIVLVLSNVISNVPVILMLYPLLAGQPADSVKEVWYICAWVATVAGNLTMLGSAAQLIVAQIAVREGESEYNATNVTRFSFMPTVLIVTIGILFMPELVARWAFALPHNLALLSGMVFLVVAVPVCSSVLHRAKAVQTPEQASDIEMKLPKKGSLIEMEDTELNERLLFNW